MNADHPSTDNTNSLCARLEARFIEGGMMALEETDADSGQTYASHAKACGNCTGLLAALSDVDADLPLLPREEQPVANVDALLERAVREHNDSPALSALGQQHTAGLDKAALNNTAAALHDLAKDETPPALQALSADSGLPSGHASAGELPKLALAQRYDAPWSVPTSQSKSAAVTKHMSPLHWMMAGAGATAFAAVGVAAVLFLAVRPPQEAPSSSAVKPASAQPVAAENVAVDATFRPKDSAAATSQTTTVESDPAPDGKSVDKTTAKVPARKARPARDRKPREKKPKKQVLPKLTRANITQGVRKHMSNLKPCLVQARRTGEVVPGKLTFILNWVIQPDGRTASPEVAGPPSIMRTSLPRCVAKAMGQWKFPASSQQTPVKRFPLGPLTIR